MGLFGKRESKDRAEARTPRMSSGWADVLERLRRDEGLRVLDFGPTSPPNINFLTAMGHSVYMANIVEDAQRQEWLHTPPDAKSPVFDTERFAQANLHFGGRNFDVVLLWDTADYLPPALVPRLFDTMRSILRPDGRLLAFFHGSVDGPESAFARYQLSDGKQLELLPGGPFQPTKAYSTRQIETFLHDYADVRFFLAKDNVREVIAQR